MPPKNKGKKAKKGDDNFWCVNVQDGAFRFHLIIDREKAGDTPKPNDTLAANVVGSDDDATPADKPRASGFSTFATAGLMDEIPDDDEGGGGGGLMVSMFCSPCILYSLQLSWNSLSSSHPTQRQSQRRTRSRRQKISMKPTIIVIQLTLRSKHP
jgi:hypothetical protein